MRATAKQCTHADGIKLPARVTVTVTHTSSGRAAVSPWPVWGEPSTIFITNRTTIDHIPGVFADPQLIAESFEFSRQLLAAERKQQQLVVERSLCHAHQQWRILQRKQRQAALLHTIDCQERHRRREWTKWDILLARQVEFAPIQLKPGEMLPPATLRCSSTLTSNEELVQRLPMERLSQGLPMERT